MKFIEAITYCFLLTTSLLSSSSSPRTTTLVLATTTTTTTPKNIPPPQQQNQRRTIIGGTISPPGKFPYIASLIQSFSSSHKCGGSLIAPDIILSAGHCFGSFDIVELNRYNIADENEQGVEQYEFERIVRHPKFREKVGVYYYDFMLIKLNGASQLSTVKLDTTDLVVVANNNNQQQDPNATPKNLIDGTSLTVIGWGDIDPNTNVRELADELREVEVKYIPNDSCAQSHGGNEVTHVMMCAADLNEDACQGDSGGPLVLHAHEQDDVDFTNDVQVGVVSWGVSCAHPDYPGVYSRIESEYEWIRRNVCLLSLDAPEYMECEKVLEEEEYFVTVKIKLDEHPEDLELMLENVKDGMVLMDLPFGSYGEVMAGEVIYEKIPIYAPDRGNQTYRFTIRDFMGNGVCCSEGNGFYELYVGDAEAEGAQPLLGGDTFGRRDIWKFDILVLPTSAPTMQPSVSMEPSVMPTSAPSMSPVSASVFPPVSEKDEIGPGQMTTIPRSAARSVFCVCGYLLLLQCILLLLSLLVL